MSTPTERPSKGRELVLRYPLSSYFLLTFAISWSGALVVAWPYLRSGQAPPSKAGMIMFPLMLLGPSIAGILLSFTRGVDGLRDLWRRMSAKVVPFRWYAALLIPPSLIFSILLTLSIYASPVYRPNRFFVGVLFGVPAGFLEEIGWMGYAFPWMESRWGSFRAAVVLGIFWALWHLPAVDFLGAASPHGKYWFAFFLAFAFVMTAMRALIAWLYTHTGSVLLCQWMHASSTGSLVVFSAPHASPRQEVEWFVVYGCVLWLVVVLLRMTRPLHAKTDRQHAEAVEPAH